MLFDRHFFRVLSLAFLCASLTASILAAEPSSVQDWPRFRGPECNGKCPETGLLESWPKKGPTLLWQLEGLGQGFSSVSIVDGRFFTMGDRTLRGVKSQFVIAFDLKTQKELWATRVGPPHQDTKAGPRCTPTVDGDRLYALGTDGDLVCLETATGRLVWQKNYERDFGGQMMSIWKFSESPLVDGDRLICTPGARNAILAALDKRTGKVIWKCAMPKIGPRGKDGAGYTSMIVAEIDDVRQYITVVGRGAIGVDAESGRFLWGYNRVANRVANITTPIVRGNHVFVTTSYKTGSALLKVTKNGRKFDVEEVYWLGPEDFENHHGGVILIGDHLYGGDGQNNGTPVCLDFATGKIQWKPEAPGKRSVALLYAEGHLYLRYENGLMVLVEATEKAFRVKGSFTLPSVSGPSWPHPVIHNRKLYLRDNDVLMCYDVRKQ